MRLFISVFATAVLLPICAFAQAPTDQPAAAVPATPAPSETPPPPPPAPVVVPIAPVVIPVPVAVAPPAAPTQTITGYVGTTYNYNFNRPAMGSNTFFSYNGQHNNIALNAAHMALAGDLGQGLSYVIEVDLGSDAAINIGAPGPYAGDVQEAYGVYKPGQFGLKVGKFVTYNGIEVIESGSNPTISRGYLFGLAEPFTHIGAVGIFQASDQIDVHLGVVNGWDQFADINRAKTIVAKVGIVPSANAAITVSGYAGPEQAGNNDDWRTTIDATALIKLGTTDLWVQGNFGRETFPGDVTATWFGAGVQPLVRLTDEFTLGARAELFKDTDGARTATPDLQLINISVAPGYSPHKRLLLRVEGRVDIASADVYEDQDGAFKGNQVVALAEAIVSF